MNAFKRFINLPYVIFGALTVLPSFWKDLNGSPIQLKSVPWLAPRAVAFLETFLMEHPGARVLEFGAGGSTVWLAKLAGHVVSIEHNAKWTDSINYRLAELDLADKVDLRLMPVPYFTVCSQLAADSFDIVIVDGRNRKGCIAHSLPLLRRGGVLMLDDSQRPRYSAIFELMDGWPTDVAKRAGAETRWWFKP